MRARNGIYALLLVVAVAAGCSQAEETGPIGAQSETSDQVAAPVSENTPPAQNVSPAQTDAPSQTAAPVDQGRGESAGSETEPDADKVEADKAADAGAGPSTTDETAALFFVTEDGETLSGDPERGARIFRQCAQCHSLAAGENRQGPSLHGVIGRAAGAVDGFNYSKANRESDVVWTAQTLFEYLESPRTYLPGTIMAYAGLRRASDRADVITYIIEETTE